MEINRHGAKSKEHSLETTDRKLAERTTTLEQLLQKFQEIRQGMSKSTRETESAMVNKLKPFWKHGLDIRVRDINGFLGPSPSGCRKLPPRGS